MKAVIFDMFETLITHYESPLYFSEEMAKDANISVPSFQKLWHPSEVDRSIGKIAFEEIIEEILRANGCYTPELVMHIKEKRMEAKRKCFEHLHPEIVPMFELLKKKGYSIGLISNCFSEEVDIIRESVLYPFIDAPCLSFVEHMQKPDPQIFSLCMKRLDIQASECLYVGDGGSHELEAATNAGMTAVQAVWYFKDGTTQPVGRLSEYPAMETPMDVVRYLELQNN